MHFTIFSQVDHTAQNLFIFSICFFNFKCPYSLAIAAQKQAVCLTFSNLDFSSIFKAFFQFSSSLFFCHHFYDNMGAQKICYKSNLNIQLCFVFLNCTLQTNKNIYFLLQFTIFKFKKQTVHSELNLMFGEREREKKKYMKK